MALADLMVVMNGGRIVQAGRRARCSTSPRTAFVARFIGGHNVLPGDLLGLGRGEVALRADRAGLARRRRRRGRARGSGARWSSIRAPASSSVSPPPAAARSRCCSTSAAFDAAPVAIGQQVSLSWPRDGGARARCLRPPNRADEGTPHGSTTLPSFSIAPAASTGATLLRATVLGRGRGGRQQLPGPVRPRRRSDHAALRRHRRERVQGAGRQVQGRYRHHHPVHDPDLG